MPGSAEFLMSLFHGGPHLERYFAFSWFFVLGRNPGFLALFNGQEWRESAKFGFHQIKADNQTLITLLSNTDLMKRPLGRLAAYLLCAPPFSSESESMIHVQEQSAWPNIPWQDSDRERPSY
jgi:hypothetical protein